MFSLMANCFAWIKGQNKARAVKLVIVGLDNAGKTTTLACLQGEPPDGITPTIGFANASITIGKWDITLYDLGGGNGVRSVWPKYYADIAPPSVVEYHNYFENKIYGIIFTVDSVDTERMNESKDVLANIFEDERVEGKPVVVLANKQDKENALTEKDLTTALDLENLSKQHKFVYNVFPCSALKGYGKNTDKSIKAGLDWLLSAIGKDYNTIHEKVEHESAIQKEQEAKDRKERMERIKKLREEREQAAKEAGVEEDEEDESDDDVVTGNPFRNINDQIGVTEKREKKAKEKEKKIKAYQQKKKKQLVEDDVSENDDQEDEEEEEEEEEIERERPTKKKSKKKAVKKKNSSDMTIPEITVQSPSPRDNKKLKKTKKSISHEVDEDDESENEEVFTPQKKTKKTKKKVVEQYSSAEEEHDNNIKTKKNVHQTRVITVNSLDNVRDENEPVQSHPKQKKKKNRESYRNEEEYDDDDDEEIRRNSSSKKYSPNKNRSKKQYRHEQQDVNYDNENETRKEQNIRDSRAELFRAKSYDSLDGSNVELKTKKVKKKKKKKKKIIVVEVDEDEEYYESTIRKKKHRNKTVPTSCSSDDYQYNNRRSSRPLPALTDSSHSSKLQPIKLKGRLPDLGDIQSSQLPAWARSTSTF